MNKIIKKDIFKQELLYWAYIIISVLFFNYISFETEKTRRIIMLIVIILVAIIFNVIMLVFKKKEIKFYKKFFIIALILGIIYCAIIPVGTANDEYSHILRTYEISQKYTAFKFKQNSQFPDGFEILLNLKKDKTINYSDYITEYKNLNLQGNTKDFSKEYNNTKLYSPLQYLPQVIGMSIINLFSNNIVEIVIGARIFGLLFWVSICTYAIKIIPNKKTFFSMIILMPIHLITVSALSGDTIINAVSVLFIAIIYKNFYNKEILSKKDRILILVTSIMIAVCKIVYLPLVFLILLLKKENFKNMKNKNIFIITVIAIAIICGIVGFYFSSLSLSNEYSKSSEQIKFILTKPFDYIMVLINTYLKSGGDYILQAVTGVNLVAQLQFLTPSLITYCFTIIVLLSIFINDEKVLNEINLKEKILVLAIIGITILLISTAIYVQWTSQWGIGLEEIMGLQGRYFIALILLSIFLNTKKLNIDKEKLIIASIYLQIPIIFLLSNVFFIKI